MGRRIIRRRRSAPARRTVVRRAGPIESPASAPLSQPVAQQPSPVLLATSNSVVNLVLPKLATIGDISLAGLAKSPDVALKMLVQEQPDVVILDVDFGGPLVGLDTARLMQRTYAQAAIIMVVPDIDPVNLHGDSRRFGTSWSYIKKGTAVRANVLAVALKSAVRGVQWIEPGLTRPLSELWRTAAESRDLEKRLADAEPEALTTSQIRKATNRTGDHVTGATPGDFEISDDSGFAAPSGGVGGAEEDAEEEIAPGINLKSTRDSKGDGIEITSATIGQGGIGRTVGKIRRTG